MDIFMTGLTLPFFFLFSKSYYFQKDFFFQSTCWGKKTFKLQFRTTQKLLALLLFKMLIHNGQCYADQTIFVVLKANLKVSNKNRF